MLVAEQIQATALTHIGCVRRQNEDSILLRETGEVVLAVVADGMGGHAGGAVASRLVVEEYARRWESRGDTSPDSTWLCQAASAANELIRCQAVADPALRQMGTTLVAALVCRGQLHIAHVGDSRCYRFNQDRLTQLTRDHSLVQQMVDDGLLTPEEAERSPMRNYLARSLGSQADVLVETTVLALQVKDRVLLCSDGLSNMLAATEIADILAEATDSAMACERLLAEALARGARDNVSVIVLFV